MEILLKDYVQVWLKSVQKCFQIGSRMVPSEVQIAFGVQFGLGNAFDAAFNTKTPPILEPELVQNRAGSNTKIKNIRFWNHLWIRCLFLKDFCFNFDQFWCQNGFKFWSTWKLICYMLNMPKCWINHMFFHDFARSGVWCTIQLWTKTDQKTKSNTYIDFA